MPAPRPYWTVSPPSNPHPGNGSAARADHVHKIIEPALEAGNRADILQAQAPRGGLLQRADDIAFTEHRIVRAILARHQAEGRLQVGWRKSDRSWRDGALGEEFLRNQYCAAIKIGEVRGIEHPRLEVAP